MTIDIAQEANRVLRFLKESSITNDELKSFFGGVEDMQGVYNGLDKVFTQARGCDNSLILKLKALMASEGYNTDEVKQIQSNVYIGKAW
jgi:hypothetical protein